MCGARAACTRSTSRRSRRSRSISRAIWKRRSPRCGCRSASRPAPATRRPRSASASAAIRREILLTTPEQLALLLASADAPYLFGSLKRVILDELHALVTSKRGDLLVARPGAAVSPGARTSPASACRRPSPSRTSCAVSWCRSAAATPRADLIVAEGGAAARRHHARHAASGCPGPAIRRATRSAKCTS